MGRREVAEQEFILGQWVAAGKLVLAIDYTGRPEQIADAYARSHARGYVPYVTDRSLGRLYINEGFEPEKDPKAITGREEVYNEEQVRSGPDTRSRSGKARAVTVGQTPSW